MSPDRPRGSCAAGLNVAVSGAIATGIPDQARLAHTCTRARTAARTRTCAHACARRHTVRPTHTTQRYAQARTLVSKITADAKIDVANDWKHVTLWIGGNDLCRACDGAAAHEPETYFARAHMHTHARALAHTNTHTSTHARPLVRTAHGPQDAQTITSSCDLERLGCTCRYIKSIEEALDILHVHTGPHARARAPTHALAHTHAHAHTHTRTKQPHARTDTRLHARTYARTARQLGERVRAHLHRSGFHTSA
jgi:hypothetical protein